ncbi:MAG TPA: glycosyltransferase [Solirubrobacteraceae bacterium]|nr:glycosyltransferase [Solirubrobacteraceae bacterium]
MSADPRVEPPRWSAASPGAGHRLRLRILVALCLPLAVFYFGWLLEPSRVGNPVLYAVLVAAELFNLLQALGFWWTCAGERPRRRRRASDGPPPEVDVLVPVYDEPADVVEPTIAAAVALRGARVRVWLLDDGGSDEMRALAARNGACYIRRPRHDGAKAGNINNALAQTSAPYVAVLDCDHVPLPRFLDATLPQLEDPRVAFAQTPQCYANAGAGDVAAAAWSQQALFFGAIARGKDGRHAMFCCGTNVVFARAALEDAGGFPQDSLTEDFELSVRLHERGWRSVYVPEVLALGLGPEDMASYVSQQHRWARGCLSALPRVLRARLPWRTRVQYLLSCSYFLTGWTVLAYMSFPVLRILTGAQPLASAAADQFLLHFAPYFGIALGMVALMGTGTYTFRAFALQSASFWIHVHASLLTLLRRPGSFKVTPKRGAGGPQPRAVLPGLAAATALSAAIVLGLLGGRDPSTLNNVAFALVHLTVIGFGIAPALRPARAAAPAEDERARAAPVQWAA